MGSNEPRHKGPAACRAPALHGRKWGLLDILDRRDPPFYNIIYPNERLVVETGTHWKLLFFKSIFVISHNLFRGNHEQVSSTSVLTAILSFNPSFLSDI